MIEPLPDGRVRERRGPTPSHPEGSWFYFYPKCQTCGQPKGRSGYPTCMRCRGGPRTGTKLHCLQCSALLDRDAILAAMYVTGIGLNDLALVFHLSKTRVAYIVRRRIGS